MNQTIIEQIHILFDWAIITVQKLPYVTSIHRHRISNFGVSDLISNSRPHNVSSNGALRIYMQ